MQFIELYLYLRFFREIAAQEIISLEQAMSKDIQAKISKEYKLKLNFFAITTYFNCRNKLACGVVGN